MRPYNPDKEELFTIKEDVTGPGVHQGEIVSGAKMSTYDVTKTAIGHPLIRWKDFVLEADVYKVGENLAVNIFCPRCRNSLWIKSENKQMEYDPVTNTLSVEPFMCTWEIQEEILGNSRQFGMSLCRWNVGIDKNIAKGG